MREERRIESDELKVKPPTKKTQTLSNDKHQRSP